MSTHPIFPQVISERCGLLYLSVADMRRSIPILALAVAWFASSSCLFSTTRPETTPPTTGGEQVIGPDEFQVSGLVQRFDRADHRRRNSPDWPVQATIWTRDRDGGFVFSDRRTLRSNRDGVYTVRFRTAGAVAVDMQARLCAVDLDGMECCLDNPPCPPSACEIWTAPQRVAVSLGQGVRSDLTVACGQAP